MYRVDLKTFDELVTKAINGMPRLYLEKLDNVAFVIDDKPSDEQRQKLALRCDQTLFGLYEGIPLTKRGANYNLVLPDKITIFKHPIEMYANDARQLEKQIQNTVWHEIAHYYGLDHDRIHALEQKSKSQSGKSK